MSEIAGGKCNHCNKSLVFFSWRKGKIIVTVECSRCGTQNNYSLEDSLEALGDEKEEWGDYVQASELVH